MIGRLTVCLLKSWKSTIFFPNRAAASPLRVLRSEEKIPNNLILAYYLGILSNHATTPTPKYLHYFSNFRALCIGFGCGWCFDNSNPIDGECMSGGFNQSAQCLHSQVRIRRIGRIHTYYTVYAIRTRGFNLFWRNFYDLKCGLYLRSGFNCINRLCNYFLNHELLSIFTRKKNSCSSNQICQVTNDYVL